VHDVISHSTTGIEGLVSRPKAAGTYLCGMILILVVAMHRCVHPLPAIHAPTATPAIADLVLKEFVFSKKNSHELSRI
jgi:hypothetical protein